MVIASPWFLKCFMFLRFFLLGVLRFVGETSVVRFKLLAERAEQEEADKFGVTLFPIAVPLI